MRESRYKERMSAVGDSSFSAAAAAPFCTFTFSRLALGSALDRDVSMMMQLLFMAWTVGYALVWRFGLAKRFCLFREYFVERKILVGLNNKK